MKALERIGKWLIALSDEWVTKREILDDLEEIRDQAADRWHELNKLSGTVGDTLLRFKNHEGAMQTLAKGLDELKSDLGLLAKTMKELTLSHGTRIAELDARVMRGEEELEGQKRMLSVEIGGMATAIHDLRIRLGSADTQLHAMHETQEALSCAVKRNNEAVRRAMTEGTEATNAGMQEIRVALDSLNDGRDQHWNKIVELCDATSAHTRQIGLLINRTESLAGSSRQPFSDNLLAAPVTIEPAKNPASG